MDLPSSYDASPNINIGLLGQGFSLLSVVDPSSGLFDVAFGLLHLAFCARICAVAATQCDKARRRTFRLFH